MTLYDATIFVVEDVIPYIQNNLCLKQFSFIRLENRRIILKNTQTSYKLQSHRRNTVFLFLRRKDSNSYIGVESTFCNSYGNAFKP